MATKDTIEATVIQVVQDHSNYSRPLKEKWTSLYKRYENKLREGSITADTESKVRLGQAYSLVENFVSKIIAQRPQFNYLARERGDAKAAEVYNEFNSYQHDIANSQEAYEEIAKWAGICGLSGFLMGWKVEETVRKVKGKEILGRKITNPVLVALSDKVKIGKSIKVDETETISNWTITPIKPHDLIWDETATSPEESNIKGYKARKTLRKLKEEGYDTKKLSEIVRGDVDYWRKQMEQYPSGTTQKKILDNIEVEVSELYIKQLSKEGIEENLVATLAGVTESEGLDPIIIRCEPNPFDKQFCPVNFFRPVHRPGKVEGFGIVEPVESILDAEEDTYNMTVEAAWTDISRPMEYVPDNLLNEESLEFRPRTLVPVRALGQSINVMDTPRPDSGTSSFLLGYAEKSKQNVSAVTDYQTGANQVQNDQTAYEVSVKTFLSEQRLNNVLRSFEQEVLETSGKQALWLNQQYLGDNAKIVYRVLGKKGSLLENQVKFKDIEAIKDLAIVGGSSAYTQREQERNKWASLLQLATQEAALGQLGVPVDREYIWKHLIEDGYFIEDSENIIPSLKDREEATVQKKLKDIKEAKRENQDPARARIEPEEDNKVHMEIHRAALQAGGYTDENGAFTQYSPEEMLMLSEHYNTHARALGGEGAVPSFAAAGEQGVAGAIANQLGQQNGPNNGVSGGNQQ